MNFLYTYKQLNLYVYTYVINIKFTKLPDL